MQTGGSCWVNNCATRHDDWFTLGALTETHHLTTSHALCCNLTSATMASMLCQWILHNSSAANNISWL